MTYDNESKTNVSINTFLEITVMIVGFDNNVKCDDNIDDYDDNCV